MDEQALRVDHGSPAPRGEGGTFQPAREWLFQSWEQAVEGIGQHREWLYAEAQRLRWQERVRDQCFPVERFTLRPARPEAPPLVLLGGMGPLVGADAFESACRRFQQSREIVLLQACTMPDRAPIIAIARKAWGLPGARAAHQQLVGMIREALAEALRGLETLGTGIELIVLCNTAHAFLPEALQGLAAHLPAPGMAVRCTSLVEAAISRLQQHAPRQILTLYTTGTRLSQLYAPRLEQAGLPYVEPPGRLDDLLMRALFQGIKAFDPEEAVVAAVPFFEQVAEACPEVDCLLAGCTELPLLQRLLEQKGPASVRQWLASMKVVDPMEEALRCVGR